jgi:hypothetical protein
MALGPESLAKVGRAAVLPDDRVADRLSGLAIPHNRGLALIGNADGRHIGGSGSGLSDRLKSHRDLGENDLFRTVLHPPGLREYLIEFLLRDGVNCSRLIKQQSSRACRPLVQG